MAINTNGFITEYIKAVQTGLRLEKEEKQINDSLVEPYKKIQEIEEEYGVKSLEQRHKEVLISKKDNQNFKTYFYFRSIVDGLYNLLKEYGWKYSADLFTFLRDKYNIRCCFEYGFDVYYVDTICDFSPTQTFGYQYLNDMVSFIVCDEYDTCDEIKIPDNLNIDDVLTESQGLLKELVRLDNQKERDEEFKLYMKLKQKYEPVESGDGIN